MRPACAGSDVWPRGRLGARECFMIAATPCKTRGYSGQRSGHDRLGNGRGQRSGSEVPLFSAFARTNCPYFRDLRCCSPTTEPKVGSSNLSGRVIKSPVKQDFLLVLGRLHVLDVDQVTVAGTGNPVESGSRPHVRPTSIPWAMPSVRCRTEKLFNKNAVLPFALELAVMALDADLLESGRAVGGPARFVVAEYPAGELVQTAAF